MADNYQIPPKTRIGHIHLKVSDLDKALSFYCDLLGFTIIERHSDQVAFISAGGYHHHIGLNTWYSKDASKASKSGVGLFHAAILYHDRKDLAQIFSRLREHNYPLTGASDHGVSEAIYLDDPDGNGLELYWDRPASEWPRDDRGDIKMYTRMLNIDSLLSELKK